MVGCVISAVSYECVAFIDELRWGTNDFDAFMIGHDYRITKRERSEYMFIVVEDILNVSLEQSFILSFLKCPTRPLVDSFYVVEKLMTRYFGIWTGYKKFPSK